MVLRRMCNLKLRAPHTFVLRMKHIVEKFTPFPILILYSQIYYFVLD